MVEVSLLIIKIYQQRSSNEKTEVNTNILDNQIITTLYIKSKCFNKLIFS